MLTWPHTYGDWQDLDRVEAVFLAIACAVCQHERLIVSCYDEAHRQHVQARLHAMGVDLAVCILCIAASNDSWARDHGPITVTEGQQAGLYDFRFNGWGKYPYDKDNQVTRHLHEQGVFAQTPRLEIDMILEGGSIESDGAGTLLTTSRCLFHPSRNPGLSHQALTENLRCHLGIHRILWLTQGQITGDDTDGHIDMLARFCDPHTLVYHSCSMMDDPDYPPLKNMERQLHSFQDRQGQPYHLIPLPAPKQPPYAAGKRLPASYANFLIINDAILVPEYQDESDQEAQKILGHCFPDRAVIGIDCLPLIEQNGSLHCVTMQIPAGVLTP